MRLKDAIIYELTHIITLSIVNIYAYIDACTPCTLAHADGKEVNGNGNFSD